MSYKVPKMNWTVADGVNDVDMNRIEVNTAIALGVLSKTTVFDADGSVTQTYADGSYERTVFTSETVITKTYYSESGVLLATKTVTFNADDSISEVIS